MPLAIFGLAIFKLCVVLPKPVVGGIGIDSVHFQECVISFVGKTGIGSDDQALLGVTKFKYFRLRF